MFGCEWSNRSATSCFFLHANLLTVLAVMLHTFPFPCTYRHCQALTYAMIIGLWLDRLLGNIFLHAFQQLSIVPVWASTFGLPLRERHTIFVNWLLEWFTNSCWMFNFSAGREGRRPRTLITPPHPPRNSTKAKNAKTLGRFSGRKQKQLFFSLAHCTCSHQRTCLHDPHHPCAGQQCHIMQHSTKHNSLRYHVWGFDIITRPEFCNLTETEIKQRNTWNAAKHTQQQAAGLKFEEHSNHQRVSDFEVSWARPNQKLHQHLESSFACSPAWPCLLVFPHLRNTECSHLSQIDHKEHQCVNWSNVMGT